MNGWEMGVAVLRVACCLLFMVGGGSCDMGGKGVFLWE